MTPLDRSQRRRFVFISSNRANWGGSEELWGATAIALAQQGHSVTVLKPHVDETQPRIRRLRELACEIRDLARLPLVPRRLTGLGERIPGWRALTLRRALSNLRADLIVLSQGGNFDGLRLADVCRRMGYRYVLVSQKACDLYWPADAFLDEMRAAYSGAAASFFVSEHNLRLTEEQFDLRLENASVVRNPFLVPWERRDEWPSEEHGMRLACVGRLYPAEKGQDLLLRVLAHDRWRARAVSVTFFGSGSYRKALERMAAHLGLKSVSFAGFVDDVASIWSDHHALVLPSRWEGLPLVIVEAMLSGRVPIVTAAGGSAEVVRDGVTGFVAETASERDLDDAMERAWQRRAEWRAIGATAADEIRSLVPEDPAAVFAETLVALAAPPRS